jgi:hypothetical protein
MRAIKARLLECLPSCRTFLDVDGTCLGGNPRPLRLLAHTEIIALGSHFLFADLRSGSGITELDKSGCILVFCTSVYFEKRNSLRELYRAVCQSKHILAMLEPDVTQQGGLDQVDVRALITKSKLEKFKVRS